MSMTTKDIFQEILNETQNEMATYRQLSKKKKKEKKLMLAYRYLKFREVMLKEEIKKLEGGEKI